MRRVRDILSNPRGVFVLITVYSLFTSLLLCPLDALDMLTDYNSPMFFTVPLGLLLYPMMFIVTGAAAGRYPKKLWPVPLAVLLVLFAMSNIFGSYILAVSTWSRDIGYYIRNSVFTMLVYAALGYFAMLLSWLFSRKREELYSPRFWAVLGIFAMGPLTFGAAYIPGFCWGHPLWGEALWYLMHLGLAAVAGILSGRDIRRYFFMPLFPLLVTYMQICPPVLPGSQPKLPWELGESWDVICFFIGVACMLASFYIKLILDRKSKARP